MTKASIYSDLKKLFNNKMKGADKFYLLSSNVMTR